MSDDTIRHAMIRGAVRWLVLLIAIVVGAYYLAFETAWLDEAIAVWFRVPGWVFWIAGLMIVGVIWFAWEYKHAPLVDEHGRPVRKP